MIAGRHGDIASCDKCKVISRYAGKRLSEIVVEGQVRDDGIADGSPGGRIPREIREISRRCGYEHRHVPS